MRPEQWAHTSLYCLFLPRISASAFLGYFNSPSPPLAQRISTAEAETRHQARVVEDKELAASLLLPVTVEKTNKKAPPLPAVQLVSLWALLTATILLGSSVVATTLVDHHYHWTLPSWSFARPGPIELQPSWSPARPGPIELTDAEAAEVSAISHGVLWCSAAAAATAALALLLPGRRRRRVLACVTLAATATSHLMLARVITLVFTTDLGDIFWWILATVDISFLAAGDIICFLALLGRGAYANVPAG